MKYLKTILPFLACFLCLSPQIQAQSLDWMVTGNGRVSAGVNGQLEVDEAGNSFAMLRPNTVFSWPGLPGDTTFWRTYLLKSDPQGNPVWSDYFDVLSQTGSVVPNQMVYDQGNLYLWASFARPFVYRGDTTFPLDSAQNTPNNNFLAKLDTSGNLLWTYQWIGWDINAQDRAMNVDPNTGDIYVGASLRDPGIINGDTIGEPYTGVITDPEYGYLLRFNNQGQFQWRQDFKGPGLVIGSMKMDPNGNPVILGEFRDSLEIPGDTLYEPNGFSSFMVRVSPSGMVMKSAVLPWFGTSYPRGQFVIDPSGKITIATGLKTFIVLGGTTIVPIGNQANPIIIGLNSDFSYNWHRFFPFPGIGHVAGLKKLPGGKKLFGGHVASIGVPGGASLAGLTAPGEKYGFAMVLDSVGAPLSGITFADSNGNVGGTVIGMGTNSAGTAYLMGTCGRGGYVGGVAIPDTFSFSADFSFFTRLSIPEVLLRGKVYYDLNANGMQDGGELGAQMVPVLSLPDSNYFLSQQDGKLAFLSDTGNYNLSILVPPTYFSAVPQNLNLYLPAGTKEDSSVVFGLQPIGQVNDLMCHINSLGIFRPGGVSTLGLFLKNVGTTTQNATAELVLSGNLNYQSAVPAPTSVSGDTLTWDLPGWIPGSVLHSYVLVQTDTTAQSGDQVFASASISPFLNDTTFPNNFSFIEDSVRTSYDPNRKTVQPGGYLTPEDFEDDPYLYYTVEFQNTGNDTAFRVLIRDSLPPSLNPLSVQFLGSSHPTQLKMRSGGVLEWVFDPIVLPDSNVNEPGSRGFVSFRLLPEDPLQVGDEVRNRVGIYFDYNQPVVTEWATTRIWEAPSLSLPADATNGYDPGVMSFSWTAVPFATSYEMEHAMDSAFTSGNQYFASAGPSIQPPQVASQIRQYWRVRGLAEGNFTPWSETWWFIADLLSIESQLGDCACGPNPVRNAFRIRCEDGPVGQVQVFDLLGREFPVRKSGSAREAELDLSSLETGLYLLKIEREGVTEWLRIVKE